MILQEMNKKGIKSKHLKACLALCQSRFLIKEGPRWHSVSYGFGSERVPLGTQEEVFTIFCQSFEEQSVPSELSTVGAKRGMSCLPMRILPSRRPTQVHENGWNLMKWDKMNQTVNMTIDSTLIWFKSYDTVTRMFPLGDIQLILLFNPCCHP